MWLFINDLVSKIIYLTPVHVEYPWYHKVVEASRKYIKAFRISYIHQLIINLSENSISFLTYQFKNKYFIVAAY